MGGRRAFFYACSSYYHRGRSVCDNGQALPMDLIKSEVLDAFRTDLLNSAVLERALAKLEARLMVPLGDAGVSQLEAEERRLRGEIERLAGALAAEGALSSLLAAIRQREERLDAVRLELHAANRRTYEFDVPLSAVMPEVRRRFEDWRSVLSEESSRGRRMLRLLLDGRLVFTPRDVRRGVRFSGVGDLGQIFSGLIDSQAWRPQRAREIRTNRDPEKRTSCRSAARFTRLRNARRRTQPLVARGTTRRGDAAARSPRRDVARYEIGRHGVPKPTCSFGEFALSVGIDFSGALKVA